MSIVRKISRDVLSDALLEEIDKKLSEDEKLSYNNLLDKPFIPEPITEVPEDLLSEELQEKINSMMPSDATIDWSKVTNAPEFSTLDLEDVQNYVVPEITSLREEIYGKIDAGAEGLTKEEALALLASSIGTTELTPDLLAIINNKMNKGSGISYSQILDPPTMVTSVNGQTGDVTITIPSTAWNDIANKPTTFTPSTHSHAISDVTNLQSTLDAKTSISTSEATPTNNAEIWYKIIG